jgi:apolipoprotein N-acyltransferase
VLLAGAVPVAAFPGLDLEFLAWVGLVPGFLLLRAAPTAREASVRGWWFGTGYMLAAVYWLLPNLGPGLLLVAIVLGAPWAGIGLACWHLLRGREQPGTADPSAGTDYWRRPFRVPGPAVGQGIAALLVLPSIWVLIELLRSWQGIGGPWAVYGATQWQHPAVLALAAVGGIWLITFALVAANTGITIGLTASGGLARAAGVAGAVVAIAAGPAAFAVTAAPPITGHVSLALVQPGLNSPGLSVQAREFRLTKAISGADLVVWGESSIDRDLNVDHGLLGRLAALSASVGARLLVSTDSLNPAGQKSKVAVLIGPGGIEGSYVKTRLVPFGEYIPFRSLLGWLTSISKAAPQNMIHGNGAHVLHAVLPGGRRFSFGVLICFESAFPDMSRVDANQGAQVLIYQTSDSTFQRSWAPEQHASLAALRAAETGRPAVQAALSGDSAAFDDRGRLLAWADTNIRGVRMVTIALPTVSARTPFDQAGDYVPWFCVGVVVIGAAALVRRRLTRTRPAPSAQDSPPAAKTD